MDTGTANHERFHPSCAHGLTAAQVDARLRQGLGNAYKNNKTKSYRQIFRDNLLTFFNILNAVLAALVVSTGHYKDLAFMMVILANLGIGLFQEIKAKRTLDRLSLLVASRVRVVRDGREQTIPAARLVLDDIVKLKTGDQLTADCILREGYLEVNESLLTGEADAAEKRPGDFLYSGSFIVSGAALAQVEQVGEQSFANKISSGVKSSRRRPSEIKTAINRILRIVSVIVIPVGILMFLKQYNVAGMGTDDNIVRTVAAMIGMIPEGLFLITSISLAASAVILAYKQTLVQDLYSIETLAYVDVLCLDKTGTLTEGVMQVDEIIPIDKNADHIKILGNLARAIQDENSTIAAIRAFAGVDHAYTSTHEIPFSSQRKCSGASFTGQGTYMIGAFEFLFREKARPYTEIGRIADAYADRGSRVLILAHSPDIAQCNDVPANLEPLAIILISDRLRKNASEALQYFYGQDVDIKIISGDNPKTVCYAARKAGVKNAAHYIDASTLETDAQLADAVKNYTVFGRVSPAQKKKMMLALKEAGHTVAMTGDGVNDVLALKEADCSVAMASGSDAAKNISTLVLLDSDFAHMPSVVAEGRKVINNLQRVATLFITKTVYAVLLAISALSFMGSGYPFSPLQLTMLSFVTIGFPAFFLAFEPNNTRVGSNFLLNVFAKSLPGGVCVMLSVVVVNFLAGIYGYTPGAISTMCIVLAVAAGMIVVAKVSMPFSTFRKIILASAIGIFVVCMTALGKFFNISPLGAQQWLALALLIAAMPFIMKFIEWAVKGLFGLFASKKKAAP